MSTPHGIRNAYVYGNQTNPAMLHRSDCPHAKPGVSVLRPATSAERNTLPDCADCARKEAA